MDACPRYAVKMEFGRDAIGAAAIEYGIGAGILAASRAIGRSRGLEDIVPAVLTQRASGFGSGSAAVLTCGRPYEARKTLSNSIYASPESMQRPSSRHGRIIRKIRRADKQKSLQLVCRVVRRKKACSLGTDLPANFFDRLATALHAPIRNGEVRAAHMAETLRTRRAGRE
jgi:hypothetical protein